MQAPESLGSDAALVRDMLRGLGDRVVQVLTPHGVLLRPLGRLDTTKLPPALQASGEGAALEGAGS